MMNRWVSGMGSPHRPGVAHRRALRADGPTAGARHANGNRAGIGGTVRGNAAGREQREHAGERVLAAVRADDDGLGPHDVQQRGVGAVARAVVPRLEHVRSQQRGMHHHPPTLLRFLGVAGQEHGEAVALDAHAHRAVVDGISGRRAGERAAGRPRREQHQGDAVRPRAEREAADSRVHGDDGNVPGREVPQQRAVARGGARCAAVGEGADREAPQHVREPAVMVRVRMREDDSGEGIDAEAPQQGDHRVAAVARVDQHMARPAGARVRDENRVAADPGAADVENAHQQDGGILRRREQRGDEEQRKHAAAQGSAIAGALAIFSAPCIGSSRSSSPALGNHEFDWSVDTLRARMAEAHYRFLAANITDTTGRARPDWAEPWTLLERGGQKIAVIGLALRATPTNTAPRNVTGLAFGDGAAAVKRVLPQARAAASFVIVVAHEGALCDAGGDAAARPLAATACHGEILDVARRLDSGSVDLIVSGHTHSLVNTVVNGIPVVQARSSGAGIAVVDFVRGPGGRREVLARIETPFTDRVSPDPELQNLMALFKVGIENLTSRAITRIEADLRRQGDEYGLGRLIADAMRNVAKADVAIVNNGGIRADLAAGTATYGDLYRVMPFQNRMLRLTVKGDVLRLALEHAVAGDRPDGHVSGVELWYDPKQRPGRRIGKAVMADGKGIYEGRSYTLAVSDFLATGGSGYTMLVGSPAADLDAVDLDAFIQYLAVLRQPIAAPDDARLHKKGGGG